MKKRIKAFIAATLAACAITAEAATGSSGWSFVDTTSDELKISDVVSKYFDGEYGGNVGRKSTFLNGTSCEIEMDVIVDDYSKVDHWLVNGREVTDHLFTFDVGSIGVGGKLEVVAVGKKDGERSKPFRVNFDVAKHVDDETPGLWTARPSNSEGIDEIVYTLYGGSPSVAFQLAPEQTGTKPKALSWLPGDEWSLAPKIELKLEVRSDGNGSCTFGTVGSELGTSSSEGTASHKRNRRAVGKLARVMDKEVGITFTGGPLTMSWNPQKKRWVAEDVSFGGEVSGSFGLTHHYPTPIGPMFLEGKVEAALSGMFKISGIDNGWGGLESSFTLSSERLPKVTVAGGYGINNVANVKGSLSGMSVLEATHSKGAWTDVRWGLRGSGAITAKFLPFEATLFELTSDTLWIINNSSPKSMRLMSAAPDAGLEWRLQSRDYLSSPKNGLRLMSAPGGTDFAIAESGGYPEPAPAMASGVKGDALAYLRDNAARSSANRTELVLRIGTSNEWGSVETVWDDGTADFLPSLAAMSDGSIAAAWMNASRTFTDGVTVDEFCGAEEIAAGIRNASTGAWTCKNLTSDGAFDFSPVVRAAANGKVLVAWLRNASGKMTSSASEPTDIMAAVYSGGAWGGATAVKSGVGIVNGFDVAFNGENAVLAFSKDSDGNPSTVGDAEMYAVQLSGGSWGEPAKLTASGDADGMPLVRVDGAGGFAVLWTVKGVLMETTEFVISNAVAVAAADGWTLPAKPVMIRGTDGRDALVWNDISKAGGAADAPTAMMYDPVCGAWGAPVKLFDDERRESRLSGAIGIDGGLRIGYESASVTTNAAGEMLVGTTEVRTRFVPAQCDLAVEEDGFSFSTDEFTAGEEVSLTVKAANLGFWPATGATVKVYEEKDDARTELASVVTNFPGGGVVAVTVPWTVDNTQTNLKFTVEVDSGANGEPEDAKDNNVYSWFAGVPDVSFGTVMVRNESATRRLLTANVVNKGLGPLPAGAKVVFRRGGVDGEIIAEEVVGELRPGENGVYGTGFAWDMEGVAFTAMWETVCVQLYAEGKGGEVSDVTDTAFVQVKTTKETQASVIACETLFGESGMVTLDENDNVVVTLTNNVSGTVEIPDNVGAVTIDLNGHDIVGDGGPAIRIVKGDGEGSTTQLSIDDTSEGEKGQIAGGGESAGIEVAEDAATGVKLDVEEGVGVFNGDGSEQELKPMLVGTGKVTVPKTWKVGQKVTWKATADKGSVFARWEGPLVDSLNLTRNERRNPSLAFAVPEGFETNMVTAVFIPLDDDGLYALGITQAEFDFKETVSDVWVTDDSQSYVTASVSGLPTGLKFDAKKMCITGAPTKGGVYWVQIKAKNASGYQWAENVKVTVSGDGKEAKEPKLTRTAYYPLTVICATEGGTVSGTGVYAEGKKVTIKATAAKGYVFAGWYDEIVKCKMENEKLGSAASMSVTVPEMRYVFAKFVTVEEDRGSIELAVNGEELRRDGGIAPYQVNIWAGVYMEWPVAASALSETKVKVAGLPSGLKFAEKDIMKKGSKTEVEIPANTIYGAPTAASKERRDGGIAPYQVKITVTTAGKSSQTYQIDMVVDALPEWAVGTFDGVATGGTAVSAVQNGRDATPARASPSATRCALGIRSPSGVVSLTIAANGKISGKLMMDGETWMVSGVAFETICEWRIPYNNGHVGEEEGLWRPGDTGRSFGATVVAKYGKSVATNYVEVSETRFADATSETGYRTRGVATARSASTPSETGETPVLPVWTAWQNLWKTEPWKSEAKAFAKASALAIDAGTRDACPYPGTITLKFAASGAVTASGKFVTGQDAKGKDVVYSASCKGVLVPEENGGGRGATALPDAAGAGHPRHTGFSCTSRLRRGNSTDAASRSRSYGTARHLR